MNKQIYFWALFILCFCSCQKNTKPVQVTYSRDYRKAWAFLNRDRDSAFYYFNNVVTGIKDSLQVAMAYNQMGAIQSGAGDYFGSQESLLQSLKYLDESREKNRECLASDYNELGLNSMRLKNYEAAIDFFELSAKFLAPGEQKLIAVNNKAWAYEENGSYTKALPLYESIAKLPAAPETYARIQTNLATTKWLQNAKYNAGPELLRALHVRQRIHDRWGENSSYKHLASYYAATHPDSAIWYATKMYAVACQINSPDDKLIALRKLAVLSTAPAAKNYFAIYIRLNDSVQDARNAAKNQFALIRYNAEKAKSDNLKLQKDNSDAKYQILWQRLLITAIIICIAVAILALSRWLKQRKHEQEATRLAAIRDTQLKDAKSVHDTLGNDVYYLLKKVQSDVTPEKGWLVNYINEIYERARDLSREISPETDENFNEYISERLQAFATQDTQVILVGNGKEYWEQVKPVCKVELKHVLQELMVNMGKHSQATRVVIRFEEDGDRRRIYYSDNGVGLPEGKTSGHGLKNTENRIKTIGGDLSFGSQADEGLLINIIFPI